MRVGDHVHHGPTGETWIVSYVDGDKLSWCGWPPGEADIADCAVVKEATEKEHLDWLKQLARSGRDYPEDKACRMARAALKSLQPQQ